MRETVSCTTLVTFAFWLWMAANGLNCDESKFMVSPLGVFKSMGLNNCEPLFSSAVSYGNLLFLAGVGAHFEGTVEEHTKHVLDELEKNLKCAGSSMEKVLKVNVYLNDIKDWGKMNTVYAGRWGSIPPVRTTIAPAGGIPGNSLVEIDLIAYI